MTIKKLTVRRKGYTRKSGVRVRKTTYKMKDVGKPGRTPKSKRWFKPKGKSGFKKEKSLAWNYRTVKKYMKGDLLAAGRKLIALANVTVDKPTERKARKLGKRFLREYKRRKK